MHLKQLLSCKKQHGFSPYHFLNMVQYFGNQNSILGTEKWLSLKNSLPEVASSTVSKLGVPSFQSRTEECKCMKIILTFCRSCCGMICFFSFPVGRSLLLRCHILILTESRSRDGVADAKEILLHMVIIFSPREDPGCLEHFEYGFAVFEFS